MIEKEKNKFIEDFEKLEVNSLREFFVYVGIMLVMILAYPVFYIFDKVGKNDWN